MPWSFGTNTSPSSSSSSSSSSGRPHTSAHPQTTTSISSTASSSSSISPLPPAPRPLTPSSRPNKFNRFISRASTVFASASSSSSSSSSSSFTSTEPSVPTSNSTRPKTCLPASASSCFRSSSPPHPLTPKPAAPRPVTARPSTSTTTARPPACSPLPGQVLRAGTGPGNGCNMYTPPTFPATSTATMRPVFPPLPAQVLHPGRVPGIGCNNMYIPPDFSSTSSAHASVGWSPHCSTTKTFHTVASSSSSISSTSSGSTLLNQPVNDSKGPTAHGQQVGTPPVPVTAGGGLTPCPAIHHHGVSWNPHLNPPGSNAAVQGNSTVRLEAAAAAGFNGATAWAEAGSWGTIATARPWTSAHEGCAWRNSDVVNFVNVFMHPVAGVEAMAMAGVCVPTAGMDTSGEGERNSNGAAVGSESQEGKMCRGEDGRRFTVAFGTGDSGAQDGAGIPTSSSSPLAGVQKQPKEQGKNAEKEEEKRDEDLNQAQPPARPPPPPPPPHPLHSQPSQLHQPKPLLSPAKAVNLCLPPSKDAAKDAVLEDNRHLRNSLASPLPLPLASNPYLSPGATSHDLDTHSPPASLAIPASSSSTSPSHAATTFAPSSPVSSITQPPPRCPSPSRLSEEIVNAECGEHKADEDGRKENDEIEQKSEDIVAATSEIERERHGIDDVSERLSKIEADTQGDEKQTGDGEWKSRERLAPGERGGMWAVWGGFGAEPTREEGRFGDDEGVVGPKGERIEKEHVKDVTAEEARGGEGERNKVLAGKSQEEQAGEEVTATDEGKGKDMKEGDSKATPEEVHKEAGKRKAPKPSSHKENEGMALWRSVVQDFKEKRSAPSPPASQSSMPADSQKSAPWPPTAFRNTSQIPNPSTTYPTNPVSSISKESEDGEPPLYLLGTSTPPSPPRRIISASSRIPRLVPFDPPKPPSPSSTPGSSRKPTVPRSPLRHGHGLRLKSTVPPPAGVSSQVGSTVENGGEETQLEAETDKMGEDLERALEKIDAEMDSDDGMWMERVEGVKIGEARVRKGGRKEGELQKGDRKRCGCSKVHRGSHGN